MIPANIPDKPPLTYADSFDVPILLRNKPASKPRRQWRTAKQKPWPTLGGFPASNGWYISTTTWREIIKAAIDVGRDVTPHLLNQPRYAHSELVARVSPLYAYLGMHPVVPRYPVRGAKDWRLTLNPVFAYGTERSAKNAASYRLGMTMAEWACRSLLGLGQTEHLELGGPIPALRHTFMNPNERLPDLWGRHQAEGLYWLIEAKGGNVGSSTLHKGWEQLAAGSKILSSYSHRTVLVGACVRPGDDLFLTIDHDLHPRQPPIAPVDFDDTDDESATGRGSFEDHISESDDALIGAARAQMLVYLALRSAPASQLRTVLVPTDRASRRERRGLITPLEDDGFTRGMRAEVRGTARRTDRYALRAWTRSMGLDDFLTCRIPGTEVHLGMSRKLFATCELLHQEDLAIAQRTPELHAEDEPPAYQEASNDAQEERRLTQRRIFREQQEEARPRLRYQLRDAYERGDSSNWGNLLQRPQEPELSLEDDGELLEAVTPETYLAVSNFSLPPTVS